VGFVERGGEVLDLQVVQQPLPVDLPVGQGEDHLGAVVALQQVEEFVEGVGAVVARRVDLVDQGFAGGDVDGGVTDREDAPVLVEEDRDDVVLPGVVLILEIGARGDDVADVALDLGGGTPFWRPRMTVYLRLCTSRAR